MIIIRITKSSMNSLYKKEKGIARWATREVVPVESLSTLSVVFRHNEYSAHYLKVPDGVADYFSKLFGNLPVFTLYRWYTLRNNEFPNSIKRVQTQRSLRRDIDGTIETIYGESDSGVMYNCSKIVLPFSEKHVDLFCQYENDIACIAWEKEYDQQSLMRIASSYADIGFGIGSLSEVLLDSSALSFLRFSYDDVCLVSQFWGHKDDIERIVSHLDPATSQPYKSHSELASFLRGELY